ncbi:MAG: ATP-binding protein [Armatimonadota bacterium]|nr:ATP-binding protein [Armatimonadota bacterium]MDW8143764.1 ATP-binding protein [Armatimonadota bacterium]
MNETLRSFLREVLNTPLKQELLAFLASNQAMDTAQGLSIWLGRTKEEIQKAAEELVEAGLLNRQGEGEDAIYSYYPREEVTGLVDAFLQLYQTARSQLMEELNKARQQVEQAWEQLRALQWEQSRFRLILSSMTDGVVVLLPDGTVSYLNESGAQLLGSSPAELTGKSLRDLNKPIASFLTQAASEVAQPPYPAITREWTLPNGSILRANLLPVFDPQKRFVGVVCVLSDITRTRQREREQREMLSVLAHDIKSPITAIRGFALSGLKGYLGELPQPANRAFQVIAEQTDRIYEMVQQIVQLVAGGQGLPPLHPVRFDLREVVQNIAQAYEGECAEKNLSLSVQLEEQPVWVYADQGLIERMIDNLLSNAVKYNRDGGKIWVRVLKREGEALLEVEDTGVGIPPSELPFIFHRFYRASTAKGEGSGLGLSFVQQVVEAHGGLIEVNSSVGQGSLFRVILPLTSEPALVRSKLNLRRGDVPKLK